MPDSRIDRIPLPSGIARLGEVFGAIAKAANQAGQDGWEYVDEEVKLDDELWDEEWLAPSTQHIEIRYRRAAPKTLEQLAAEQGVGPIGPGSARGERVRGE